MACGWGRPVSELATRATDSGTVRASPIDQEQALRRLHAKLFPTAPLSLGGSDHCPSQAPPCRILWETWLIGHGGIAHSRTILEGAQIWNHSRLSPSIEGVSPCESS